MILITNTGVEFEFSILYRQFIYLSQWGGKSCEWVIDITAEAILKIIISRNGLTNLSS
jgi:hypothetical protein